MTFPLKPVAMTTDGKVTAMATYDTLADLDRLDGTIAVVGSMNADYTVTTERLPGPGETVNGGPLRILPGGKSGNQAAAAARLGVESRLFGAVGSDANADLLLGKLNEAGVNTSQVMHAPGPSGTTVITVDAHGENTIVYSPGSNARVDTEYVHAARTAIEASGTLGLCLESPIDAVTAAARICHDFAGRVLLNNSPFSPVIPRALAEACDVLLVNEHEMAAMLDLDEPQDDDWSTYDWARVIAGLHALGFDQAIVTLGADGSVVLDARSDTPVIVIDPVHVDVVDTTGCGDAYMGTVLAGLASGFALDRSARLASYVSAYAATGRGAQASYGTAEQIRAYFA